MTFRCVGSHGALVSPIPRVRRVKVAGGCMSIRQSMASILGEACQTALGKAFTEYHDGAPRASVSFAVCQLVAGKKPADGELHVRRAPVADFRSAVGEGTASAR